VKRNPYEHKDRPRRPEPTPASLLSLVYMSYLSRAVMAVSRLLRVGVRQIQSEEQSKTKQTIPTALTVL
jgi:hypothetical protein